MPTFSNISNGESGLSVRNTLNQVIDYVNTGITQDDKYVTGATYNNSTGTLTLNRQNGSVNVTGFTTGVTETQNLENVLTLGNTTGANDIIVQSNILVGNGNRIQETISGNTYIEINQTFIDINGSDGGVNSSYLNVSDTSSTLSSTDGTDTSTQTLTPTSNVMNTTNGTRQNYVSVDGGIGNVEISSQDGVDYQSDIIISTDFGSSISLTSQNITTGEITTQTLSPTDITSTVTDGTNTSTETITPTGITTTSTGSVYISGGTSVELEYYGSPTITSYLLMNNTGTTLHTDDGLNTNQVIQTPIQTQSTITDGNTNNFTEVTHNGFSFNVFVGGPSGYNNELVIDPSQDNRLQSTDGTSTTTIMNTPTGISLSSTDGPSTTTQNIGPTGFDITTSDGLNSVGFVGDYSQFNVELYDDNVGTTSSFGLSTSQSEMNATDGTNTSNIIIQPNDITSLSISGTNQSQIYQDTISVSITSSDVSDTSAVSLTPTTAGLSVDTPSNSRYNEVTLTTGINLLSSSGGTSSNIQVNDNILLFNSTDGVDAGEFRVEPKGITFKFIPAFDDDADAGTGGLTVDMLYQTTGLGAAPLDVAGILMIKQ